MLALPYIACKYECYQLHIRTISCSKHTKLKNTKIYSKGVLVNHTKISTNENFPLYGNTAVCSLVSMAMTIVIVFINNNS